MGAVVLRQKQLAHPRCMPVRWCLCACLSCLEDAQDLSSRDGLDLRDSEGVAQHHADLRGGQTLLGVLEHLLLHLYNKEQHRDKESAYAMPRVTAHASNPRPSRTPAMPVQHARLALVCWC